MSENIRPLKLLPHQFELLSDTTTKIIGLCSGFGGGKTFSAARKAVHLAILNPGVDGIVTEPTFPLLVQVMFPELIIALDFFGVPFKFNKVESIFYCHIDGKQTRIICGSMENYTRLIGINAAWCVCDEFDTAKEDIAYAAYVKLLGRLRNGNVRQMVIVSTPEGFRAMHRIFIKENDESKRLIKAKTQDNYHLPQDYIDTMRAQFPENLICAYLEGEFVNLTSGTVYQQFDRKLNHCDDEHDGREPVHIGMDFNVGKMSAIIHVERSGQPRAVGEILGAYDTPEMIRLIKQRFWDETSHDEYVENCQIYVYPDASGSARKTVSASTSDLALLREAGFIVMVKRKNPSVRDRITSVNSMFCNAKNERRYLINTILCPAYTDAREQQIYNKNGEPDKINDRDHPNDAGDYYIHYQYPAQRPSDGWL
jgi:phage terminase large subunit